MKRISDFIKNFTKSHLKTKVKNCTSKQDFNKIKC